MLILLEGGNKEMVAVSDIYRESEAQRASVRDVQYASHNYVEVLLKYGVNQHAIMPPISSEN